MVQFKREEAEKKSFRDHLATLDNKGSVFGFMQKSPKENSQIIVPWLALFY